MAKTGGGSRKTIKYSLIDYSIPTQTNSKSPVIQAFAYVAASTERSEADEQVQPQQQQQQQQEQQLEKKETQETIPVAPKYENSRVQVYETSTQARTEAPYLAPYQAPTPSYVEKTTEVSYRPYKDEAPKVVVEEKQVAEVEDIEAPKEPKEPTVAVETYRPYRPAANYPAKEERLPEEPSSTTRSSYVTPDDRQTYQVEVEAPKYQKTTEIEKETGESESTGEERESLAQKKQEPAAPSRYQPSPAPSRPPYDGKPAYQAPYAPRYSGHGLIGVFAENSWSLRASGSNRSYKDKEPIRSKEQRYSDASVDGIPAEALAEAAKDISDAKKRSAATSTDVSAAPAGPAPVELVEVVDLHGVKVEDVPEGVVPFEVIDLEGVRIDSIPADVVPVEIIATVDQVAPNAPAVQPEAANVAKSEQKGEATVPKGAEGADKKEAEGADKKGAEGADKKGAEEEKEKGKDSQKKVKGAEEEGEGAEEYEEKKGSRNKDVGDKKGKGNKYEEAEEESEKDEEK